MKNVFIIVVFVLISVLACGTACGTDSDHFYSIDTDNIDTEIPEADNSDLGTSPEKVDFKVRWFGLSDVNYAYYHVCISPWQLPSQEHLQYILACDLNGKGICEKTKNKYYLSNEKVLDNIIAGEAFHGVNIDTNSLIFHTVDGFLVWDSLLEREGDPEMTGFDVIAGKAVTFNLEYRAHVLCIREE